MEDIGKELTLAQVFVHYSHFCDSFVEHCSSKEGFVATCHADRYKENGLIVIMNSTLDEPRIRNILASFVNVTNRLAPGLRMKIEPAKAGEPESEY